MFAFFWAGVCAYSPKSVPPLTINGSRTSALVLKLGRLRPTMVSVFPFSPLVLFVGTCWCGICDRAERGLVEEEALSESGSRK